MTHQDFDRVGKIGVPTARSCQIWPILLQSFVYGIGTLLETYSGVNTNYGDELKESNDVFQKVAQDISSS